MKHALVAMTVLTCTLFAASAVAAPVAPPKPAKNVETRITSDKMTYLADKQQVVFESNVHVQRPDFELWSSRLTVYMKPAKKEEDSQKKSSLPSGMAAGDVDKIVAEQNVRMKSENRTGTCNRATYTVDNGVLVMDGDPRLTDGENTISGEVIRYFTEENRSEVQGGARKRVEAVFSSPDKPAQVKGGR